jgi:hypothetical protein
MHHSRAAVLIVSLSVLSFASSGCRPPEVVEYTAPKETFPEVSGIQRQLQEAQAMAGRSPLPHGHAHGHGHAGETPSAELTFVKPENWEEQPLTTLRKASFIVRNEQGAMVDISVMSFPGDTGGLHANVNRWREQVGLKPAPVGEMEASLERLTLGGRDYIWVDLPGPGSNGIPQRIMGAIAAAGTETWFFKMMGDDALTAAQREPLLHFLESLKFTR